MSRAPKAARKVLGELWGESEYAALEPPPPADPKKFDFGDMTIATGDHVDYLTEAAAADVKRICEAIAIAPGSSHVVIASIHAHEARRKLEVSDLFIQPFARACIVPAEDYSGRGSTAAPSIRWPSRRSSPLTGSSAFGRACSRASLSPAAPSPPSKLFPITLGFGEPAYRRGTPLLARGKEATAILGHLAELSAPYGTALEIDGEVGRIHMA